MPFWISGSVAEAVQQRIDNWRWWILPQSGNGRGLQKPRPQLEPDSSQGVSKGGSGLSYPGPERAGAGCLRYNSANINATTLKGTGRAVLRHCHTYFYQTVGSLTQPLPQAATGLETRQKLR